jgi:DNA repair protein REV1
VPKYSFLGSLGQARQLCAEVITLPYEFEKYKTSLTTPSTKLIKFDRYKEISLKFYTVLLSYADELQAVSVDEALLDVSHAVANLKVQMLSQNPENVSRDFSKLLAKQIRERMLVITGCQGSLCVPLLTNDNNRTI